MVVEQLVRLRPKAGRLRLHTMRTLIAKASSSRGWYIPAV